MSTRDAANAESDTIEKSITVKSYADFYRDKVIYPTNTDKVTYDNSDINNGNFTDSVKDKFKNKIQEANANNNKLPTGVTYTKGNTDDKTKVVGVNFPDGSTIDISHTLVAKPTVPTITPTETEGHKAGWIADSDRTISGTALNSATKVTLIFQDGKTVDITDTTKDPEALQPGEGVIKNGKWTYKMPDGKYLRQTDQTAVPGSSSIPFKATQTVFDAVSDEAQIFVAKERTVEGRTITAKLGDSSLQGYINNPETAVTYKERGKVVTPFPSDFEARWNGETPKLNTVGTFTYKVKFYEKDGTAPSNRISEGVDVKFIIRANSPSELTATQKQNGETEINIPTDADEVTFKISKGNEPATTLVAKKSEDWALSNELISKSSDNKWKFSSHEDGTYTITAVATTGNGETKSDETTTEITSNSHKVTKADIIKKPTDTLSGTDLYSATGVVGVVDNGIEKTYQNANITSVTSDGQLPELEADTEKQVSVVITYNDGSKEKTTVTLKVAPAAPNVTVNPQDAKTGDVKLTIKRHNDTNYPDNSVVTVPGIDGTFKVKDGTITIKNEQLKDKVQTGKVTVKEDTKLPAETDGDKVIPAKLKDAGTAVVTGTQDPTTGNVTYHINKEGNTPYENGTKVTIDGVTGEYTVTDGTITVENSKLPNGKVAAATVTVTEDGHKPATTTTEVPAKKVPSATPIFTVGTQDELEGHVDVTVTGVPDGTKVKLPGVNGEKEVKDGKVILTNDDLPEKPTKGKGSAQEVGKLPTEGTSEITIPGKLTSAKGAPAIEFRAELPLPLVVPDPKHLTPSEIAELENRVKKANPDKEVTVDDKGNVTVTDKNTGESALLPVEDLTVKDFTPVKPNEKVPAKDKDHLTPEEKKQVEDKVKAKNPGKEVTVGEDGTATVTDPNTRISHEIPGKDLVVQDFTPVKPDEKVPVKDKSHLTAEEKKQVEDKVKAKNPGKEVTVGEDGTATVTDPTTGVSHIIPGSDLTIAVGNDATENNRPEDARPDQVPATPEVPDNNGQDTPAVTPSNDDTANNSDAINPSDDVADTENTQVRLHRSQAILPNTGTAESAGFLSAAASMIAGLGFLIPFGKRRKKEEEKSQND